MLTRFLKTCGLLVICAATTQAEPATQSGSPKSVEITVQFLDIPTSLRNPFIPDGSFQPGTPDPLPPGIMSLAGVLTKEQLGIALKDILNNEAVDTMTLPVLFARSGSRAKLLMVQEVRYGIEFSPNQSGAPLTPTKFDTRDVGVTMEALPTISADGYTIDLTISPRLVRLIGYQEPGEKPVYFERQDSLKNWATAALPAEFPQNGTAQPIFASQELTTQVTVYNGSSVILGGLTSNDPLTREKRSAFMIVTARLVP